MQRRKCALASDDCKIIVTNIENAGKTHYISFAVSVYDDRIWFQRLYPEQSPAFRMPVMKGGGNLNLYCTKDGLFRYSGLRKRMIKNI